MLIILSRRRSKQWFELSETLIFLRLNIEIPEGGDDKELALEMTLKADLSMMELIVTGFAEEGNAGLMQAVRI